MLRVDSAPAKAFIEVIEGEATTVASVKTTKGGSNQGTYATELVALRYAGWISAKNDLVEVTDGKIVVNSLRVADKFGKAHRDILRAIRNLDCSSEFIQRNFAPSSYTNRPLQGDLPDGEAAR